MIILCLVEIQTSEGVYGDPLLRSLLLYTPDHKSYKTWNLWSPEKQKCQVYEKLSINIGKKIANDY